MHNEYCSKNEKEQNNSNNKTRTHEIQKIDSNSNSDYNIPANPPMQQYYYNMFYAEENTKKIKCR